MDPEIVKTATELAKATGAAAGLSIPFTAIVKRMLGPAADELAEMWRDQVRLYRYERQLKCVQKAEKMAQQAGFAPQAVPPKILFPLLEGASFEDDENLHDMWAALLANAASPNKAQGIIRPSFIAILKQLAPEEASLLDSLYQHDDVTATAENEFRRYGVDLMTLATMLSAPAPKESSVEAIKASFLSVYLDLHLSLDGLMAQQLIKTTYWRHEGENVFTEVKSPPDRGADFTFTLTRRGKAFIEACRPPKPKS